ncbi:MAG: hypothetical protein ACYCPF_08505 [Streptosporangiaceae bacterium]
MSAAVGPGRAARSPRILLGWRYAPGKPDPGPPPDRHDAPADPAPGGADPGWGAAQRRIGHRLARPARIGIGLAAVSAALTSVALPAGVISPALAGCAMLACGGWASRCAALIWLGRRHTARLIAAEEQRMAGLRAEHGRREDARRRRYAADLRSWRQRAAAFQRLSAWQPVSLPADLDRIDVAGGTAAGWAAMITTIAAPRLAAGGEVTVLDLTEQAVTADLVAVAGRIGLRPLVLVLPGDLPRLDLGAGLAPPARAEVLALAAGASEAMDQADGPRTPAGGPAAEQALLERILGALGPEAATGTVTAALRVLAGIGDPRADLRAGLLTAAELDRLTVLFGRGASERIVIERAWSLESRLRRLDGLGSDLAPLRPSPLRIASLDRSAGPIGNRMLATYLVAAVTHLLRQAPRGPRWAHALALLGAERLADDLVTRLAQACESSGSGLVLGYRSVPAAVRERLGRGNAAVAFMRLGNGTEARAASELIGTEHRLVVSQFTDTVGTSVTDTSGDSYTGSLGSTVSAAGSSSVSRTAGRSRGHGRSQPDRFGPFGDLGGSLSRDRSYSVAGSVSRSLTEGMTSGTSWGRSTSRALGENAGLGRTVQRSREFLVEADELQRLPPSAAIISHPASTGRTIILADLNPAIGGLPDAVPIDPVPS